MVRLTRVRVQYLLDDITCSFSPLQAAMAFVNNDKIPNGPRQIFEAAALTLSPHCPVQSRIILIIATTLVGLVVALVIFKI